MVDESKTYDSRPRSRAHIETVQQLLMGDFQKEMMRRAGEHDLSKLVNGIERDKLDELEKVIAEKGPAKFGTPEYERRSKEILAPMIEAHYAKNDHHPEHYKNGIAGMSLPALVEMFFDWVAANKDRDDGAPMQLTASIEKHKITAQLGQILKNTADLFGVNWE